MNAEPASVKTQAFPSSESEFRNLIDTVLDTIVDGVITVNLRGEIQHYNDACERLFGYSFDDVRGKNISMLMPEPMRSEHDGYMENYRQTGIAKIIGIGREVTGLRKDGTTFPMELAIGTTNREGEYAYVGIIRDVTERYDADKAREQLRQAQKMEAIGQLTGGIAHDFNNLLAVIVGNLDFLNEKLAPGSPLLDYIKPAIEAALRGSELTQQLLAFGRKQALQPKNCSLIALITHFSSLIRRTLGERIELVLALSADTWHVHVDPGQLENVLLNLSVNARDAMPAGGKIIYETKNTVLDAAYAELHTDVIPGEYVMLAVSDTGTGMSHDTIERAFEPFFTTKEIGKGSGMGLSMVYGFVKQSAGHIKIYSELGHGTTIRIYLPRADAEDYAYEADENAEAVPIKVRHVLVVEDNPDVLRLTSSMVESLGYKVLTAASGDEAMGIIESRNDIDLLLTDVMLPGSLNGPAMAKRAMELRPALKVLFNSGYAEHAIFESGLLDEGVHLISKPFRKAQLAHKITEILND